MAMIRYSIHDLVDVHVDPSVNDWVMEQIDFQIGYFKTNGGQNPAPYQIFVKPYDHFEIDPSQNLDIFHLVRGIRGKLMDDPQRRIVVEKKQNGYTFYADSQFLINLYIQLLLKEHDISFVHAAAVADPDGRVTLFPGAGGVGKTALMGYLVNQCNYRTLGDDIVGLSDQGECFSFPRSFVLKEYHRTVYPELFRRLNIEPIQESDPSPILSWFKDFIKENAPFKGVIKSVLHRLDILDNFLPPSPKPFLAAVPVADVLGQDSVVDRGRLNRVLFMQRYCGDHFQFASISEEELSHRMFSIIQHEWVSAMRELFALAALEIVNLPTYFNRTKAIMKSAVAGIDCKILYIPNDASPKELRQHVSANIDL